ncbi:DUF6090 family protein [Maribacter sp. HTCC2170]|uniref:DUF6090 family protein n=1 Tax=Maribacter sp. (strain HTCC2170 / KCCM 42371) TaxID=313603 RepID=UPI00006AFC79|nr:DUF6090 family protein [Maribacter sp. HTCC2170]EAR01523.1 hypothetical protein FB2170_12401 [Maribacter sp. HTCC2170]
MIKFFRKIRQKLLTENKFSKYLLYAIGEIVLVVIGILIALNINTWNEEKQNQKEAHKILLQLKHEFEANNDLVETSIEFHRTRLNAVEGFIDGFETTKNLSADSLKALVSDLGSDWKYEPVKNIIESVISSGKINLIENDSVIQAIRYWGTAINKYDDLYRSQDDLYNKNILPILTENYPFFEFDPKHNSKFEANTDAIFKNLKNENSFLLIAKEAALLLYWTEKGVKAQQDDILSKIDQELKEMTK